MKQSNEMILQSVSVQLHGMNTTIENMKEDGEGKYSKISENITIFEKVWPGWKIQATDKA